MGMSILLAGNAGVVAEVDEGRNVQIYQTTPGYPAAGGFYSVAGKSGAAAIAATLATDTTLMSARLSAASIRKAYITSMRVFMSVSTAQTVAGVPGVLGLQKFTTAAPSGGTSRTSARMSAVKGTATDITDIRDNNAALTVTSVVFTDEIAWALIPGGTITTIPAVEWIIQPAAPIELVAGDGVCLRTRQVCPSVATWYFTYTMHWYER